MSDFISDDRLFLIGIYPCQLTRIEGGAYETMIYYDSLNDHAIWAVVYYRNEPSYPITHVFHFDEKERAEMYRSIVEPSTPLKSLGGQSPSMPLSYAEYQQWKLASGLSDFDPNRAYVVDDTNRRDLIIQTEEQLRANFNHIKDALNL